MQKIYLDISNKGVVPTIHAKQGDVGRKFGVVLTDSGLPYIPTSGSAFSVWYSGASGEGNYTDIGEKSAFSVNENEVTVEMITQMLSNEGEGILSLVLNDNGGNQIGLWSIRYVCESVPGANSEKAKEYYSAFSESVKKLSDTDAILRSKLSVDGTNTMEANLPMGNHRVTDLTAPVADGDAVNLAYTKKVGNPHNLLDNGDFRNPVNQRCVTNGTVRAWTHFIDRWKTGEAECQVSFGETGISINGDVMQYVTMGAAHKTLTLAAKINGIVYACSGVYQCADAFTRIAYQNLDPAGYITIDDLGGQKIRVLFHQTGAISVEWVALYEGEYTTENLPEYQPKGHAAEFAECRRYYQKGTQTVTVGTQHGSTDKGMVRLRFENMRITPTISLISVSSQGWGNIAVSNFAIGWNGADGADHIQNYIVSGDSTFVGQTVGISYEASAEL